MEAIVANDSCECAWCGRRIREGSAISVGSYGICVTCLGDRFGHPVENVSTLSDAESDQLPFGFIRLDSEGRVIAYNTQESALSGLPREGVLGKNFFRAVAPCTCVEEFEGMLQMMIASGQAQRRQIEFLFKFEQRSVMVNVTMSTDPRRGYTTLLIRKVDSEEIAV
jgi:photoactive yellow protein